jgi:hypothetical protein
LTSSAFIDTQIPTNTTSNNSSATCEIPMLTHRRKSHLPISLWVLVVMRLLMLCWDVFAYLLATRSSSARLRTACTRCLRKWTTLDLWKYHYFQRQILRSMCHLYSLLFRPQKPPTSSSSTFARQEILLGHWSRKKIYSKCLSTQHGMES